MVGRRNTIVVWPTINIVESSPTGTTRYRWGGREKTHTHTHTQAPLRLRTPHSSVPVSWNWGAPLARSSLGAVCSAILICHLALDFFITALRFHFTIGLLCVLNFILGYFGFHPRFVAHRGSFCGVGSPLTLTGRDLATFFNRYSDIPSAC